MAVTLGRRFRFPADLADSQGRLCQAHQKEADALIKRRMARAEASNPAGRRMTADASARLPLPRAVLRNYSGKPALNNE